MLQSQPTQAVVRKPVASAGSRACCIDENAPKTRSESAPVPVNPGRGNANDGVDRLIEHDLLANQWKDLPPRFPKQ